ncbi:hypothetical protein BDD12DRAFT_728756, partial [Trichophaea hybrida]
MDIIPKFKALLTSSQNSKVQDILGSLRCIEYDKERKECLQFLQYDDTRYGKIVKEHRGSLEWLWDHPKYLQWSASPTSSLLYIEGKPGSGKSTLAKYVKKNLIERQQVASSSTITVANYFYTFRGTERESTHENMLRSILYSILEQDESTFFHFQLEFRNFLRERGNRSEWPYDSLKTVLSSFTTHYSTNPLYLIFDAMDESNEEHRFSIIQLLCELCSAKDSCIKVFIASRPLAELKYQIEGCHHVIRLQEENKNDIERFVEDFLRTLKLPDAIHHEAANYINNNAEGVFVWVQLVKAELIRIRATALNDIQLMEHLERLPTKLAEFYKLMFNRLKEEGSDLDIEDGMILFQFVLCAVRPLTVAELHHVLAIPRHPDPHFKPSYTLFKNKLVDDIETRIMHCGGNFLEITGTPFEKDTRSTRLTASVADKTIQLMHQTAREFLLQMKREELHSKFTLSDEEAHKAITITSVRYLMLCFINPERTIYPSKEYARYIDEWPWINYALHNLKTHHDLCGQK